MNRKDDSNRVKRRRKAIAERLAQIEGLERRIHGEKLKLRSEDTDLASTEKILDHLAQLSDDDLLTDLSDLIGSRDSSSAPEVKPDISGSIPRFGTPRPAGIPATSQMIDSVLADAERAGIAGLRGHPLVAEIQKRWWPGIGTNSILPTAFALVKRGRLGRRGKLFVRIKKETTAESGVARRISATATH